MEIMASPRWLHGPKRDVTALCFHQLPTWMLPSCDKRIPGHKTIFEGHIGYCNIPHRSWYSFLGDETNMGWKITILWVKSHFLWMRENYNRVKLPCSSIFLNPLWRNIKRLINTLSSVSSQHCTRPEVQACSAVINKTNFIDRTVVLVMMEIPVWVKSFAT